MTAKSGALLLTDDAIFPVRAGLSAMKNLGSEMVLEDEDVVVITQCGSLGGKLPIESGSLDVVVSVWKVAELIGEQWLQEIGRVLKRGGRILVQIPLLSTEEDKLKSTLERKILVSGFLEVQALEQESSVTIKGKKPTWTMGSSFPIKKAVKTVPKIQIEDESDLIDEDSLLTEEDLMKPQLPPVGDCEVGSTRKACKNCTCGRAEAEEKVQKLGLTAEQINNPQSACGNCGLGDAFRCGGCPYRGLPPFKLGEKEEHHAASISDNHETTCWGCGLHLLLETYLPTFKCGWCGAITHRNKSLRKPDSICFSHWRLVRDRFFVTIVLFFILFVICAGVWAVYPTVFSISYFCGIFHSTLTAVLSISTISSFCLAAFRSAGAPPNILWGSYPIVAKGDLENYTFCMYCAKPKPPRAHHCRSCRICVLDMDHHCPFIGNCVGAENHRFFIAFLTSVIISCTYVVLMTLYAGFHIWPPLELRTLGSTGFHAVSSTTLAKEIVSALASSALLLSARECLAWRKGVPKPFAFLWLPLFCFQGISGSYTWGKVARRIRFQASVEMWYLYVLALNNMHFWSLHGEILCLSRCQMPGAACYAVR